MAVVIYTDGGCWPNPGAGGWGAVITMPSGAVIEMVGGEKPSTNNRMELMGPIAALESLDEGSDVIVYCDNKYVVDGITTWIDGWKKRGWVTKSKEPVKNMELWQRLDAARSRHRVKFEWVRGHSGVSGNERADVLSQAGAAQANGGPIDFDKYRFT